MNFSDKVKQKSLLATWGLWLLFGGYVYILLLSPSGQIIPGEPVWAIQPDT